MGERGIIIADRDSKYRSQMANFFTKSGYRVETTDSSVHVMCSILKKQTPVLLMGNNFDNKISSVDLIHLLKKCNSNLNVIMVSDDMPLAQARKVREAGIFYHALKPTTAGDTEELDQAVACAFEKQQTSAHADPIPDLQSLPLVSETAEKISFGRSQFMKVLPWIMTMMILAFVTTYISLPAAEMTRDGSSLAIWILLSFCALLVSGQLMPIFRVKLMLREGGELQAKQENTPWE